VTEGMASVRPAGTEDI